MADLSTEGTKEFEKGLEDALSKIAPPKEGQESATSPEEVTPKEEPETPPAETPREEPPKEEPKETPTEEPSVFDVKAFNERFGSDFQDEEILKSSLARLNELQELDNLKGEKTELETKLSELSSKYEEAKGMLDPRKYFANEDEYKRQLILQKHGQELNPALLNQIVSADLDGMNDMDVLVLGKMVATPGIRGGADGAREMIYRQLGVDKDLDPGEWDLGAQNLIAEQAAISRRELKKIRDIEVPEKVDFEAEREARQQAAAAKTEELKGAWGKVASEMVDGFDTLKLSRETEDGKKEVYFTYNVDEDFKKEATDLVVDYLINQGEEPTKQSVREAEAYVRDLFLNRHANDIIQAYGADVEAKLIEKYNLEQDNPKPPNDSEAPEAVDKDQQELFNYVKESFGRDRKEGDKLFG
jgi:hypothetical protein